MAKLVVASLIASAAVASASERTVFEDSFRGTMQDGWSWIRGDEAGRRIGNQGLEIRVQPGNMWGGANDAKNVLVRPVPEASTGTIEVSVVLENHRSSIPPRWAP